MTAVDAPPDHRQRLLDGLAQSIREKGLAATQVADVVRHARASRRTFYRSFPDKEACFVALAEQLSTQMLAAVEGAIDPAAPWASQVDQAIDRYVGLLASEPAMTVTFSRDLPALGPQAVQRMREGIERYAALLVRVSRAAVERGEDVAAVPMPKAIMLVGGLREMVVHAVDHGEPLDDVGEVAKQVFRAVIAAG